VAVCIVTRNEAGWLRHAVDSACAQDWPDTEVWVFDAGSTDETPELMASLGRKYADLHYAPLPDPPDADRWGWLCQPGTEFVVRLGQADQLLPGYVRAALEALREHSGAAYAHTSVQECDSTGNEEGTRWVEAPRGGTAYRDADDALRALVEGSPLLSDTVTFRTSALCGPARDGEMSLPPLADYELFIRLADAGHGSVAIDEALASVHERRGPAAPDFEAQRYRLRGYRQVFEDSLLPAFRRRGWDTSPIARRRIRLAKETVSACFHPAFTPEERADLLALVLDLGDSPGVRARIRACSLGLGFWFDVQSEAQRGISAATKTALARLRARRRARV